MRQIKVILITDSLIRGGKERRMVELIRMLSDKPFLKIILVLLKDLINYTEIFDMSNVNLIIYKRKIKKDPIILYKIYSICKQFKPDIIHSWGSMPSVYVFLIAKILNIKFINAMISNAICSKWSDSWWRAKITFPFSDIIVSNSFAGIRAYKVPEKKAKVIYNGFDFDRLSSLENPHDVRKRFNIKTKFVVGMVGAFYPRKDYDTFLEAAKKILQLRKDITFIAVGEGQNFNLYRYSLSEKYSPGMVFTGQQDNVESLINIFDIGILTTNPLVHEEGISNSIMEYMALAKPVIATKSGGTNEIIVDKVTGFIIDPISADQLISKILYLINNPEEALMMGIRGKERVKSDFNIEKMINSTMNLYLELLNKK